MTTVQFQANDRSALHFSGTRDVMRSTPVRPQFGAQLPYRGRFNDLKILTDFNDQSSNVRVLERFQTVQQFITDLQPGFHPLRTFSSLANRLESPDLKGFSRLQNYWRSLTQLRRQQDQLKAEGFDYEPRHRRTGPAGSLHVTNVNDVPLFNINHAAQELLEQAYEPNKGVFIHVTDPGVGSGGQAHKRSILVTQDHGVHVGPNNGSLSLLTRFLELRKEPYQLLEIDLDRVARLEEIRTGHRNTAGSTFHGRDVFAVVAGAIAAGVKPESLATRESAKRSIEPVETPFSRLPGLPENDESVPVSVKRDNTSGNLVLNIAVSPEEFTPLRNGKAVFELKNGDHTLQLPAKKTFAEVALGEPLIYPGSKRSPESGKLFLEVALNRGDASAELGLDGTGNLPELTLKRLR